jgi:hypothetical protein
VDVPKSHASTHDDTCPVTWAGPPACTPNRLVAGEGCARDPPKVRASGVTGCVAFFRMGNESAPNGMGTRSLCMAVTPARNHAANSWRARSNMCALARAAVWLQAAPPLAAPTGARALMQVCWESCNRNRRAALRKFHQQCTGPPIARPSEFLSRWVGRTTWLQCARGGGRASWRTSWHVTPLTSCLKMR